MEKKIEFEFERETKRTYRFKEVGDNPIIRTLYVQKFFFKAKPERVELTIRTEEVV